MAYILCVGPRVAALIPAADLRRGIVRPLSLVCHHVKARHTRPTPFRPLPRTVDWTLSRIGIVQFVYPGGPPNQVVLPLFDLHQYPLYWRPCRLQSSLVDSRQKKSRLGIMTSQQRCIPIFGKHSAQTKHEEFTYHVMYVTLQASWVWIQSYRSRDCCFRSEAETWWRMRAGGIPEVSRISSSW